MWRQPAQERNKITITVPLHAEPHIWELLQAPLRKEVLHQQAMLDSLELLMMRKKQLDHASISSMKSQLILRIEI